MGEECAGKVGAENTGVMGGETRGVHLSPMRKRGGASLWMAVIISFSLSLILGFLASGWTAGSVDGGAPLREFVRA